MQTIINPDNINSKFFDGYYKEIWREIFPEKTTIAETDFIINQANLGPENKVLDLMCGYGRHTLELAKRNISVTAVDNLPEYISEIKYKSKQENLNIDCIESDIMQLDLTEMYDAVLCMGNSLQFFSQEEQVQLLTKICKHVKPGGKLFINTWMNLEIAIKQFQTKSWSRTKDYLFLTESKWLLNPCRIETDSIIIDSAGDREEKKGVDYIFSIAEIEKILEISGFTILDLYSIPGKKHFEVGDQRLYIVARK